MTRRTFLAALAAAAGCASDTGRDRWAAGAARVSGVVPRWRTVVLPVGGSVDLEPRVLYSDGRALPLRDRADFVSADPDVARVSPGGRVTAAGQGRTIIHMTAKGHESSVHVTIGTDRVAHFSRDGRILVDYEPGQSQFTRTLFGLDPVQVRTNPPLAARLRASGVNALTTGFYLNPADHPALGSLAEWRARWLEFWNGIARTADASGLGLVLTGDDLARTRRELWHSVTGPWAAASIELAFARARDCRRVVCVEMVDEVNYLWGDTPTPTDDRWGRGAPPVPDDAFVTLMRTIARVDGRPPVSWPVGGNATVEVARRWMGHGSFADYASHYWSDDADPTGSTGTDPESVLPRIFRRMDGAISRRVVVLPAGRPALMLTSVSGPFFTKRVAGDRFSPGQDTLQAPGVPAVACGAEIMYAVAAGMAGVRAYQFDATRTKQERVAAPLGRRDLQTGADPFDVGTDRWHAMAAAYGLIERLEPWILQPQISAPHLGATFVTGARQGPLGRLLVAVSFSAAAEMVTVDLGPYHDAGDGRITRYRLRGADLSADIIVAGGHDTLIFRPGEAVLWLFHSSPGRTARPPAVRFVEPSPGADVTGGAPVRVLAEPSAGLRRVELFADGVLLASLRRPPFAVAWDTRRLAPGWHSLGAVAHGAGGSSEARIAVRIGQSKAKRRV